MILPISVFSGEDVATLLSAGAHPVYRLDWANETDRFYLGANGPLAWTLTRSDGADVDVPEAGSLTVTIQGGDGQSVALDLDGDPAGYTLAALVEFEKGGSYRLRISLSLPDSTLVVTETPIYVL